MSQKIIKANKLDTSNPGTYKIPHGIIKRIHVNRHNILSNEKYGTDLPTITIKTSRGNFKCHSFEATGAFSMSQDRGKLSCGAKLWIETKDAVTITWRPFK